MPYANTFIIQKTANVRGRSIRPKSVASTSATKISEVVSNMINLPVTVLNAPIVEEPKVVTNVTEDAASTPRRGQILEDDI